MKQVIASMLFFVCVSATAQPHRHNHGHYNHRGGHWPLTSFIIGAATGAVIYDIYNRPVYVQQPPVYVQQPSQIRCSSWIEVQNPDGTITRSRTCSQ